MSCGRDCSCDNVLVHEIHGVLARINAPIPPRTLKEIAGLLEYALWRYEDEELRERSERMADARLVDEHQRLYGSQPDDVLVLGVGGEPEACGFTLVADLCDLRDPNACYSFDDVLALRDVATGGLYLAHSSGCSCPHPFEEFKKLSDLVRVESAEAARAYVAERNVESYPVWPLRDVFAFVEKIEAALKQEVS